MKKKLAILGTVALMFCMGTTAFAADFTMEAAVCYPTAVTRSEDGSEIRKMYDLSPTDDPAGIPRSDFEQDGYHYTLIDLLKQELPENESRQHTETVTLPSENKDMGSVLALLPQQREFTTEDGLAGVLTLALETVKVEVAGYGSSTKELTATRTYPSLGGQDTSCIPKEIEDRGHTLILQSIDWRSDGTGADGMEHYTATAIYAGTTTSSYVKGYTVTADYCGTVSRIILNKTRYVAIFEGTAIEPVALEPTPEPTIVPEAAEAPAFNWAVILVPIGIVALAGVGIGAGIFIKRSKESEDIPE